MAQIKSLQPEFNKRILLLLYFNLVIQYPVLLVCSVFSSHRAALAGSMHQFTAETWHPACQSTKVGHEQPAGDVQEGRRRAVCYRALLRLFVGTLQKSQAAWTWLASFTFHSSDIHTTSTHELQSLCREEFNSVTTGSQKTAKQKLVSGRRPSQRGSRVHLILLRQWSCYHLIYCTSPVPGKLYLISALPLRLFGRLLKRRNPETKRGLRTWRPILKWKTKMGRGSPAEMLFGW